MSEPIPYRPGRKPSFLARVLAGESGIAMTELAMALPFFAILGLGGLELANLTLAYLRVNDIAIKVSDNASRVRLSIDEADVKEIFDGAKAMGATLNFAQRGRIILSSIEPRMSTPVAPATPEVENQFLRWQRCTGAHPANSTHGAQGDGATGTAQADGYGVAGGTKIKAAEDTALMLVEVVYDYQPIVSNKWLGTITIRATQSTPVRQRTDQVIKNAGNLPDDQRPLCSNPHTA